MRQLQSIKRSLTSDDYCSAGASPILRTLSAGLLQLTSGWSSWCSPEASFLSVIRLTWRCPFRPSADVCVELNNSFRYKLCKVPPQLCDGTIILTLLVVVVSSQYTTPQLASCLTLAVPITSHQSLRVYTGRRSVSGLSSRSLTAA